MLISQTAEYALRAVVWLATRPEESLGTARIAKAIKVPAGYLAKVMQKLARAGILVSAPGRSGGFRLARPADRITVLEVVESVDPLQRIETCPLAIPTHGARLCPLHKRLDDAVLSVQTAFGGATIQDLILEETDSPPLCSHVDLHGD